MIAGEEQACIAGRGIKLNRMAGAGLLERLEQGHVICAEGYLFELERRGYIQAGAFVPEAVLDHPEKVTELHREFVHAGSDVVEAFTYYAHREKMRVVGKEGLLEELNRNALALAKEVADETSSLFAGDICNTNVFDPDDPESRKAVQAMFDEQVAWAAEAGVDYVIAETYSYAEEARMALETIKTAGLPAVITMCIHQEPVTRDGMFAEILPNVTGPIIVEFTVRLGYAIFTVATLAFLGFAADPSIPDWGQDISAHYQSINAGYWWPVLFPSLAIATLIVGINLIADAIAQLFER